MTPRILKALAIATLLFLTWIGLVNASPAEQPPARAEMAQITGR